MSILITGATGLIGKKISELLFEEGLKVHYLTTSKDKIQKTDNYKGFYWNPSTGDIDNTAFEDVGAIIHLAGASVSKAWTQSYKEEIIQSRVETSDLIYDFLSNNKHEVQHIIAASGISIYPSSLKKLYSESETAVSDSFLGKVTVKWEAAVGKFRNLGIRTSHVRTGLVLSEDGGALEQIVKPIKFGVGAPLASGEQWQSWIHLDDIAGIYVHMLKHRLDGTYNGVAPGPVTNKKMTADIASKIKKPLWLPNVPKFILHLLLGERADLVLESQLVSAEKISDSGYRFNYVNLESALDDLL